MGGLSDSGLQGGEGGGEACNAVGACGEGEAAAVAPQYLADEGEAEALTAGLVGEKRFGHSGGFLGRYAWSVVAYGERVACHYNVYPSVAAYALCRVLYHIDEYLAYLHFVDFDVWRRAFDIDIEFYASWRAQAFEEGG